MKVGQSQAIGGQSIQVRRVDFTTEAPEIGKAHVIAEDDDDVGSVVCLGRRTEKSNSEPKQKR